MHTYLLLVLLNMQNYCLILSGKILGEKIAMHHEIKKKVTKCICKIDFSEVLSLYTAFKQLLLFIDF